MPTATVASRSRSVLISFFCLGYSFIGTSHASASDKFLYAQEDGQDVKIYSFDPVANQTTVLYSGEQSQPLNYPQGPWRAIYRITTGGNRAFMLKKYWVNRKQMTELYELTLNGSNQARRIIDLPEANDAVRPSISRDGKTIIYEGWELVDGIQH